MLTPLELSPATPSSVATLRTWLALHRSALTEGMLRRLIIAAPEAELIFALSPIELTYLEIPPVAQKIIYCLANQGFESTQNDHDWQCIQQQDIQLIPISSQNYPELLKQITDPPPLLYVKGDVTLLNRPQLAMVGSRRATRAGGENAFRWARELARNGFVVTSGLALGIDAESHRGALAAEGGSVAVLGTGIDLVYPARNQPLFEQLATQGAIISEFPLGAAPHPTRFPKRNRVISGMSLGVLVVEAALRSGSLITARCALEQGREVFAIPGSLNNPGSRGCHALIQQGAKLVVTVMDIMEELQGWLPMVEEKVCEGENHGQLLEPVEQELLNLLGFDPANLDLLQNRSQWPMAELMASLTSLELKGLVENQGGIYTRLM